MRLPNWQRIRAEAEAVLDEGAGRSRAELSRLHRFLRFWVQAWRSFSRNRCPVRAAALAYASLLALIPLLAVVVSVTSSFLKTEGEQEIDQFIAKLVTSVTPRTMLKTDVVNALTPPSGDTSSAPESVPAPSAPGANATPEQKRQLLLAQQEEVIRARKEISRRIHQFIQNTRSGALGVTGTVALIFAAISLLGQIETTFNDIWGVAQGRSWFTRVVVYWAVISLAPLLLTVAVGLTSGPHLAWTRRLMTMMPFVGNLVFSVMPVVLSSLALALFYRSMPNTKVRWNAALVGGVLAGTLWHLNSLVSVLYVSRVVSSSKIYGSLGLVPVFMIGLYFAWWILLFGAQVAYAFQNRHSYLERKQIETIDQRGRELIGLRVMARVGRRFARGKPPPSVLEMGRELGVPTHLIEQLMQPLCAARLVVEVVQREPAYLPARPLEQITAHDILLALRGGRAERLAPASEPAAGRATAEFRRIEQAERQVAAAITLQDLAEGPPTPLPEPESERRLPPRAEPKSPSGQQSLAE